VKKLTGDFDNGLGAVLIGEHSLASFLSKKSQEGILGPFQQYRSKRAADLALGGGREVRCLGSMGGVGVLDDQGAALVAARQPRSCLPRCGLWQRGALPRQQY
jgi:hypothetical protein